MPSFINYNNKQELSSNEYTKLQISEALYLTETKNSRKIESLTEGLNRTTSLKDTLDLFENKLVAMNALSATKQTYSGTLYEGQFSWMTQDTGAQIGSEKENTIEVWMYDNKGNQYYEKGYDGYGEFGGMDYYELLARMNGYTDEDLQDKKILKSIRVMGKGSMRDIGIALAFENKLKTRDKGGDVLFPALVADGRYNWKRHNFKQEAESDPNQSWFQEEEYDDYEDDEDYEQGWYESFMTEAQKVNEWGSSDQSIFLDAMHKDAGKPKKMPSPFDSKLRQAAEDAVDFYWEDWDEYKSDRDSLVDDAVRSYLRKYFKKDFDMMVKMFEPMKESLSEAASNFRVLLRTSKDESIGRKIRLGDKRDPGHEIWEKIDKNHWMNLQTEEKLDLNEWAKRADEFNMADQDLQFESLSDSDKVYEEAVLENAVRDLHFETDPKKAEEMKIEIGISQGEVVPRKQIEGGEYSLRRFRKEIKYDTTGEDLGVFKPGSYMAATSKLGDGPHKKAVKKVKWNQKKYNQWLEDVASNDGWRNAYDMAQNAKHEPGLLDWAKKEFRGEDVMQRIQWDIEAFAESVETKKLTWDSLKESLGLNEGRSINKISKEHSAVVLDMANTVKEWKVAEGDRKTDLLEKLRGLNNRKAELEKELDQAVAGKDSEVELALSETETIQEKAYNKKSLMKAMKGDDGMIQLGDGQEYVIYAYGNGNDENDAMWGEDSIFALDQDGGEHEIKYSDIVSYNESTVNEKDDAGTHLDKLAELVGNANDFFAIGKELKSGKYKYDYSDSMMPMYMIKADGFKFAILNKRYVDSGDREVGEIAIGLMESAVTESKEYKAGDEVELKTGETVKINQVVKGPRAEFNTYRAEVKGKQIDFSLSDINESLNEQSDDALILIQQALKGMKNMKVDIKGDTVIVSNKAKDEFTYSMNDGGDVQEFIDELEESVNLAKKKVESLDESLRNDLKKFIKKNQDELDRLADGEQWEQLYLFLYTEFDVEPESDKAEELKAAFDLTY